MKNVVFIFLFGFSVVAYGQKIKVVEGDLSVLKGQTAIKTEFTYDNMSVGKFPRGGLRSKEKTGTMRSGRYGDKWKQHGFRTAGTVGTAVSRAILEARAFNGSRRAGYIGIHTSRRPGWNIGISRAVPQMRKLPVETKNRKR